MKSEDARTQDDALNPQNSASGAQEYVATDEPKHPEAPDAERTETQPDRGTEDDDAGGVPGPAFVVAGLGASAGGVQALGAFFAGLPEIDGIAFVVILHLAPDEESRLADILQSGLPLPVTQTVAVEPGHVYVIPPNKNLLIEDGHLVLEPIEAERVERRPIDHFFRTLADAYGKHAVGVILSGTGANGTVGARRLREVGGLVMAQDPEDAQFDEMPRTAIAAGIVDIVGSAGRLAAEAAAYAERLHTVKLPETPEGLPEDGQKALQSVLAQLRARTGHDFAHYKRATVLRRLDRRLHVTGSDSLDAYLDHLRSDAREAAVLLDDLLISVTNFFRDPKAFAALKAFVPRLFEGKGAEDEVRVWVPGCATGEEAYSIAMLLLEHAATLAEPPGVQVFATDLSEAAVRTARKGAYPESIEADVSAERLRRFFTHDSGLYRVSEALREAVLVAPHSLLKDPPFSRLDLVSCRNLLIYLQRDLQRKVLALFHYALCPGGLLFLGTSESTDGGPDLFDLVDKGARLYRRLDVETPAPLLPHVPRVLTEPPVASGALPPATQSELPPDEFARLHQTLREETAPPSVLINEANEIVHISDDAAPFLYVAGGVPTRNLVKMLRPELRAGVQAALFQARRDGAPVASGPVTLTVEGEARRVGVRARPSAGGGVVQLVFDVQLAEEPRPEPASAHGADLVAVLEQELDGAREQVRVTTEEFETSREELRSQNEELQSVNEELRSTAEELETSKEEAQSMAEELRTVNDELKAKVDETARAKGDLENLIVSTEIATLFLDRELRIKRFTPHVRDHFHVLASDLGRPLSDLAQKFGGVRLVEDAEAVLERLEVKEREVESTDGRWYLVHVRPYRTVEDRIAGIVITFVDITDRKHAEEALRRSEERYRLLVEGTTEYAILMLNPEGRIAAWNTGAERIFGYPEREAVGQPGAVLFTDEDRAAGVLQREMETAVHEGQAADNRWQVRKDGSRFWASGVITALRRADGSLRGYAKVLRDNTRQREAEQALRRSEERLRTNQALFDATLSTISDFAYAFDRVGRFLFVNQPLLDLWGLELEDAVGKTFHELDYPADLADRHQREIEQVFETGEGLTDESFYTGANGEERIYEYIFRPVLAADGTVSLVVGSTRDVTSHRQAALALQAEADRAGFRADLADTLRMLADPVDIQAEAARTLGEHLGASRVHYAELDSDGEVAVVARDYARTVPDGSGRYVLTEYPALLAAARAGRTFIAPDVAADDRLSPSERERYAGLPVAALVVVPLVKDGHVVGLFAVHHDALHDWTDAEVALIEETAERTWAAVERARAEAALRQSEARLRTVAETVPDVLFTTDAEGRVEFVSRQHEALTGVPAEEVMGTGMWPDLIHPDDRARVEAGWDEARAGRTPFEARYRLRQPEGGYRWVITRARPVHDEAGGLVQWFGTMTDIDALVRAEAEVRELNRTLEERVEERTAEVRALSAQLTIAEQEERRRIAQVLHDDLQQQLFGLGLTLGLVRNARSDEEAEELFDQIEEIHDQATELTRSLVVELSPPVLESERLEEVLLWIAFRNNEQYGMEVDVEVEEPCEVPARSTRVLLFQVLRELLFNVVKHAGTRHARLHARREGDYAVVEVGDDGDGFDPDALEDRPRTESGFGLASVRERIEQVGGRVEIVSAPDDGTRVTIRVLATGPDGSEVRAA